MCASAEPARRAYLDQTLAKEGETAVASARPFPMDEPAAGPRVDRKPLVARTAPEAESKPSWPVLARIADVARSGDEQSADPQATKPSYRVDAPHVYAPNLSPPLTKPAVKPPRRPGTQRPATNNTNETGDASHKVRLPESVPLPIRLTVEAWRLIYPHRELIRFTAMLALMAVGGMSMVLMMGDRLQKVDTPPASTHNAAPTATSTVVDQNLTIETNTQSVEVDHTLTPETEPDADTTSTAPTTTGPLVPESRALMAVDSISTPSEPIYPTTSYPEPQLPQLAEDDVPRVRTSEPAVAKLQGIVKETKSR